MQKQPKTIQDLCEQEWFQQAQAAIYTRQPSWRRAKELRAQFADDFVTWLGDDDLTIEAETYALVVSIMPACAQLIRSIFHARGQDAIEEAISQMMLMLIEEAETENGVRYNTDSFIYQRVKWRTLNHMTRGPEREEVLFCVLDDKLYQSEDRESLKFQDTLVDPHDQYTEREADRDEARYRRMVLLAMRRVSEDGIAVKIVDGLMQGYQKQEIADALGIARGSISRKYHAEIVRALAAYVRRPSLRSMRRPGVSAHNNV